MVLETITCEPSEQDIIEANVLLSEGKRNYVCNQPHLALDCFVELCEKLAKYYGQESENCIEAYLYYGKTLLDIARLENGVLGHAIMETPVFGVKCDAAADSDDLAKEGETEEEEDDLLKPEEIRTHVESAMREENLYNKGDDLTEDETETEEEIDDGDENKENVDNENDETNKTEDAPDKPNKSISCEVSDDEGDDAADEVSSLELAWEMLELTAVICKRQLSEKKPDDSQLKCTLAEAKHGLAQISLEMERYEDAVNDFQECLDMYIEVIDDKHSRVIAEGHYNIGLALSFDKKYLESVKCFEKAVSILKARVADLEAKVNDGGVDTEIDEWKKEIIELNDLIVLDMMAKIEDAHESEKLSIEGGKAADAVHTPIKEFDVGFTEELSKPLSADEVVNDCTANIRSLKRKSDIADDTELPSKVSKAEDISA